MDKKLSGNNTIMMKLFFVLIAFLLLTSTLFAVNPPNEGIPFNGRIGYCVDTESLQLDAKHFSVSVWVCVKEPNKVPNSMQIFISLGDTIMDGFKLYLNNREPGFVRMQVEYDTKAKPGIEQTYTFAGAPIPQAEQWTHYLGTYDGEKISIYMNGEKKGTKVITSQCDRFRSPFLTIGGIPEQGCFFTGIMTDVQIWNRALSAEEVTQVIEGKSPENGLIARWDKKNIRDGKLYGKSFNAVKKSPDAVAFDKNTKLTDLRKVKTIITIDGKPLEFFDPNKKEYIYYLPYEVNRLPEVKLTGQGTVSSPDTDQCVTVTSQENSAIYRILFKKMPQLDLFLCIGQSNMAGRGPMDVRQGDTKPLDHVFLFTPQGNWEPAANPLNRYSTTAKPLSVQQIGPSYGFAKRVTTVIGKPIGLIVNARGGTSIEEWEKGNRGEFNLYEEAMNRAIEAKKWGTYKAILWHQGEANNGNPGGYPEKLKQLVADLRNDLGNNQLFFVAGELGHWGGKTRLFNEMLGKIATYFDHSAVVSAEGLTPLNGNPNDPHFDRESSLTFGTRYGDAVLKGVYQKP